MRLAREHPDWVIGFEDETWWSRFKVPTLSSWSVAGQPVRLVEQTPVTGDLDPKALACYGLLVSSPADPDWAERVWLRFVDGRPVSAITIQFLAWCADRLAQAGKRVWVLIWDNASWHISRAVRTWIRTHNREVKRTGQGVRILACLLPVKSPWLNRIEPRWAHAKRRIVEPERLLSAHELADRICCHFDCVHEAHLTISKDVA